MQSSLCNLDEVRETLAPSFSCKTDSSGKYTLDEVAGQGQCFKVTDATGAIVAAYILRDEWPECFVLAAAGRAGVDLTAVLNLCMDENAQRFATIAFQTERRGLVKKAQRHGYEIAGYIMRKKMQ